MESLKKKIIDPKKIDQTIKKLRDQGKSIVTLNGSFDLLHAGHLYMISEAAKTGNTLIVALNSDHSIKQYKAKNRPIIPLKQRLEMMAALKFVDYVTWFEEPDPCHILSIIKPDIHSNGEEYGDDCIEAKTVKDNGGKIHLIKRIPGLATSEIIKKIKEL